MLKKKHKLRLRKREKPRDLEFYQKQIIDYIVPMLWEIQPKYPKLTTRSYWPIIHSYNSC